MTITKTIHDDKKEKHSSFELSISVPAMKMPDELVRVGGYQSEEDTTYHSYHASVEEANEAFQTVLEALSRHYNKHISDFTISEVEI